MSKNIGKIIRVNSLPPKGERLTNVIYQVAVPETATYIDYAVDENGDIKTPTLDKSFTENDFSKVKTVNHQEPDENGNIALNYYVQIYNSYEELQEIWDNAISDKVYFNHHTKEMVIGNSDGDGYSLFKMEEYLNKPDVTGTVQEYPYVVVVDNEGNSAKRSLEDLNTNKLVSVDQANTIVEDEFSIKTEQGKVTLDQIGKIKTKYINNEGLESETSIGTDEGVPLSYWEQDDQANTYKYLHISHFGISYGVNDKGGVLEFPEIINKESSTIPVKINDTYANEAGEININRFPGLEDKTLDATYNKKVVLNSNGDAGVANDFPSQFVSIQQNGRVGYGTKYRGDNPTFYGSIGSNAIDLSIQLEEGNFGALGEHSVQIGGPNSYVSSTRSVLIGSGYSMITASSSYNFIGGGGSNEISGSGGTNAIVGSSAGKILSSNASAIIGGFSPTIDRYSSNKLSENNVTVGGYSPTIESGLQSVILGGYTCRIATTGGENSAIVGGYFNSVTANGGAAIGGAGCRVNTFREIQMGSYPTIRSNGTVNNNWTLTDRAFGVGIGTSQDDRKDGITLLKNGLMVLPTVTTTLVDSNAKAVVTKEYLDIRIPKPPTTGNHVLKAVNGVVSWVTE